MKRGKNEVILEAADFKASHEKLNVMGVFNPGVARYKDEIILLVRVAEIPMGFDDEKKRSYLPSPRIETQQGKKEKPQYHFDLHKVKDDGPEDPSLVTLSDGTVRVCHISHIQIARFSPDGFQLKSVETHPDLFGSEPYEEYGMEDPRISQIGDTYYITYVAISKGMNVSTCLMTTKDFNSFQRHGVLFPCENKDVIFHPEKFGDTYFCYHRPVPHMIMTPASMWTAQSKDLLHWGNHRLFLPTGEPNTWDALRNGGGTTVLKTKEGWLQLYHGVGMVDSRRVYRGGAVLTSLEDPTKPIAKTMEPILSPEKDFELTGFYPHVVFPTGWIQTGEDEATVYYGCADERIAAVKLSLSEILSALTPL